MATGLERYEVFMIHLRIKPMNQKLIVLFGQILRCTDPIVPGAKPGSEKRFFAAALLVDFEYAVLSPS